LKIRAKLLPENGCVKVHQAGELEGDVRMGPTVAHLTLAVCDAKMYHMRKASVRDLRYEFKKIERLLHQGEEVQITKRRRVIARLVPATEEHPARIPDFLLRMRAIYGEKPLVTSGADLIAEDRKRY
jgi:antitoxin (DNA-binding transcriptional repressor) of toxin-antitoxin stability system